MQQTRYSGTPNPYEWPREMRRLGVETSAERLEDQSAAIKSRQRLDNEADLEHVRNLAIAAKRARRGLEVATAMWQLQQPAGPRRGHSGL
jgi:hypothetical protein